MWYTLLLFRLQHQLTSADKSVSKKRSTGGTLEEAELKRNQLKQQEQLDDLVKKQVSYWYLICSSISFH